MGRGVLPLLKTSPTKTCLTRILSLLSVLAVLVASTTRTTQVALNSRKQPGGIQGWGGGRGGFGKFLFDSPCKPDEESDECSEKGAEKRESDAGD